MKSFGSAVLAACLVAPAPLPAQPRARLPGGEAEVELAGYADRVVSRKGYREPVAHFLRVIPGSDGFGDAGRKAADLTCLNAAATRRGAVMTMRLQPATFRGAVPGSVPPRFPEGRSRTRHRHIAAFVPGRRVRRRRGDDPAGLCRRANPRRLCGAGGGQAGPRSHAAQARFFRGGRGGRADRTRTRGVRDAGTDRALQPHRAEIYLGESLYKFSAAAQRSAP